MEWKNGSCRLSDDKSLLDLDAICRLLADTYWAAGRPRHIIQRTLETSVCLGLYRDGRQIGFCRAVTDGVTFSWLCDVVVEPGERGGGLGKWMVECLVQHPALQTRSQILATQDAHTLYERFGFERLEMMRRQPLGNPPVYPSLEQLLERNA